MNKVLVAATDSDFNVRGGRAIPPFYPAGVDVYLSLAGADLIVRDEENGVIKGNSNVEIYVSTPVALKIIATLAAAIKSQEDRKRALAGIADR